MAVNIYRSIKKIYRDFKQIWLHKYKIDLGIHQKWTLLEKIKYNRLGFTNEDYADFNLKVNDYHNYISFRERWRLEDINGRFAYILGEKLIFERLFGGFIYVPHINCWVKNKKCLDIDSGTEIDILSVLRVKNMLIAKPTRSVGGGSGIHKISIENQQFFIDGKNVSDEQLITTVSSWEEYIIVDFIHQTDYSNKIYSETTNSIRVVTAKRKNGDYDVILAFHRFGTDYSRPVDNICSGGVFSLIDIDKGTLSIAKRATEPDKCYTRHPDTGAVIEGITIPNWNELKNQLIHVHRCFPFYTFLAWDVVINDQGKPSILEINRGSDLNVQIIRPLRNEKIGEFMREYGLLDKR